MMIQMQGWLRSKGLIPAARYLKTDSFGTSRTQARRAPDRTDAVAVQERSKRHV